MYLGEQFHPSVVCVLLELDIWDISYSYNLNEILNILVSMRCEEMCTFSSCVHNMVSRTGILKLCTSE